jgi:hypothetical protein
MEGGVVSWAFVALGQEWRRRAAIVLLLAGAVAVAEFGWLAASYLGGVP